MLPAFIPFREPELPPFHLRSALSRHELALRYQPIVDLESGEIVAAEALLRWHHPRYGVLPPSAFIDSIQSAGDHALLNVWLVQSASQDLCRLDAADVPHIRLALNVSPRHLGNRDSMEQFTLAIRNGPVSPARLVVELTEDAGFRDAEKGLQVIERLKSLGVRFAIDDFGTGFATLDYLARIPADVVKIDKSFIARCGDQKYWAIIEAIADLARRLGIAVVAEGIERPDQLLCARECGIAFGQGYLFAEPLQLDDLAAALGATPGRHRLRLA